MGLLDVKDEAAQNVSSSSSSGSSSSSRSYRQSISGVSPDDFPVYRRQCPEVLIRHTEEDGWDVSYYPHTPEIVLRFEWYGVVEPSNLGYLRKHEGWVRWWWTRDSFEVICRKVQKTTGEDLRKQLDEDPEKALKLIRRSANQYAAQKVQPTERCPVCRDNLHAVADDYELVNGRRVCVSHNVQELADAGLLD